MGWFAFPVHVPLSEMALCMVMHYFLSIPLKCLK